MSDFLVLKLLLRHTQVVSIAKYIYSSTQLRIHVLKGVPVYQLHRSSVVMFLFCSSCRHHFVSKVVVYCCEKDERV